MKAKRRHELQEDELTKVVTWIVSKLREHSKEITISVSIILLGVVTISWIKASRKRSNDDVWQEFLRVEETLRPTKFTIDKYFGTDENSRDEVVKNWALSQYQYLGFDVPKKGDGKDLEMWNLVLDIANKLYKEDEKDKAIKAYQVVVVEYPSQQTETKERASDVARRSLDYWAAEEYKTIADEYSRTKAAPWARLKSADKYYEVASSLLRNGDSGNAKENLQNAANVLKKILDDHSDDEIGLLAHSSLGYVYKELGQQEKADKSFARVKGSQFASSLLPIEE